MSGYACADADMKKLDTASVMQAIKASETSYEAAKKEHVAWIDTKAKIEGAKKLLAKKDLEGANKMAIAAKYEADTAMVESKEADKLWPSVVPK